MNRRVQQIFGCSCVAAQVAASLERLICTKFLFFFYIFFYLVTVGFFNSEDA
jgi:hypothetical protein